MTNSLRMVPLTRPELALVPNSRPSTQRSRLVRRDNPLLTVRFGQATFDAEGSEQAGSFFSRRISYPGVGDSGVTIGRGYDMGRRTVSQVQQELSAAGMPYAAAELLSKAAGLRRERARDFVSSNAEHAPVMSLEVQKKLFEDIVTPEIIRDIKRIFSKPDAVERYGEPNWESLPHAVQELVFDLRYRGDYTPRTRQRVQQPLAHGDFAELQRVINDTAYWRSLGVPNERIRERQRMAAALVSSGE